MLASLAVRDIVLIDRLGIDFGAGLTVLTGETGAGKSILLDALSLALGARGDAALVRPGARARAGHRRLRAAADHPAFALLAGNGIAAEGAHHPAPRAGRPTARPAPSSTTSRCGVALLRAVGALLVEIHGQHDDRALVDAEEHRRLLDAFGGLEPAPTEVAARYRAWRECEARGRRAARRARGGARAKPTISAPRSRS